MLRIFLIGVIAFATVVLGGCGDDDVGDAMAAVIAYENEIVEWACGCFWEEDFSSEQECLDMWAWDSDEESEIVQCSRDAMAEVETERPTSVDEFFSCFVNAMDEGRRCIRDIDHDDMCGATAEAEIAVCDDNVYYDMDECEEDIADDEDAQEWLGEWESEMNRICSL